MKKLMQTRSATRIPTVTLDYDDRSWLEGEKYDDNHFCPSWAKCCEENLALKDSTLAKRWNEDLPTFRNRFTRNQWKEYIEEISYHLSYSDQDSNVLTCEEYAACHAFMHGKM